MEATNTQHDRLKGLAMRSSAAALVMARGYECFLFTLDGEGHVTDETVYLIARAMGFAPVGTVGIAPAGVETETVPGETAATVVMKWARGVFRKRHECAELERLFALEDTRG
jgi:hypothetical protein